MEIAVLTKNGSTVDPFMVDPYLRLLRGFFAAMCFLNGILLVCLNKVLSSQMRS